MIPMVYSRAIQESNLDIVHFFQQKVYGRFERGGSVRIETIVYLMPEVKLAPMDPVKFDIQEFDSEKAISNFLDMHCEYAEVDTAEENDRVIIDFEGLMDEQKFRGGSARDFAITIGSGNMLPEFENAIAGHHADESFSVNVVFPDTYRKDLAGKSALFNIYLKKVLRKQVVTIEKAAEQHGISVPELVHKIVSEAERKYEKSRRIRIRSEVLNRYIDMCELDPIPEPCVDKELELRFEKYLETSETTLEELSKSIPDPKEWFRKSNRMSVIRQIDASLVLRKLSEFFNLSTDETEEKEVKRKGIQEKILDCLVEKIYMKNE
jgi:trigger factor